MKDVISILQSRIAKRLKEFRDLTVLIGVTEYSIDPTYQPRMHPEVATLAKQQKEDKRILAEIIKLRRESKEMKKSLRYTSPEDSFGIVLDKSVDEWAAKFMKDNEEELNRIAMNFVEARLGER